MKLTVPPISTMLSNARAYALHGAALALVAGIGWFVGSNVSGRQDAALRGADTIATPAWQPFQAGDLRARALEIANFVMNPDEEAAAAKVAEAPPEPEAPPAGPDEAWRFIGTAVHGGNTVAFIVTGKPSKLVTVSGTDPLPNGEQIVSIEDDLLRYTKDGQSLEAKLFERKKK